MKNKFKRSAEQMIEDQKMYAIPARDLSDLPYIDIKSEEDFDKIPKEGGVYWIATNEIIHTSQNRYDNERTYINEMEIVYNGMSSGSVCGRIKEHLNRDADEPLKSRSGISVEPSDKYASSHAKKYLCPNRGQSAYYQGKRIRSIEDLNEMNLNENYLKRIHTALNNPVNKGVVYMKNGIDVLDEVHSQYNWRVYYLTGIPQSYADFVEREWRSKNGQPRLNVYKSGR